MDDWFPVEIVIKISDKIILTMGKKLPANFFLVLPTLFLVCFTIIDIYAETRF